MGSADERGFCSTLMSLIKPGTTARSACGGEG